MAKFKLKKKVKKAVVTKKEVPTKKLSELEEILFDIARQRVEEVKKDFISGGVLLKKEFVRDKEIINLMEHWVNFIACPFIKPQDVYIPFKAVFMSIFEEEEFNYWLMDREFKMQSIPWNIAYKKIEPKKYGHSRRKLIKLLIELDSEWKEKFNRKYLL